MNKHIPLLLTTAAVMSLCAIPVLAHEEDSGGATYSVGEPASAADAHRTVKVAMADTMKYTFEPDLAVVGVGEIITFEVTNNGKINHEFSIGNQEDQQEHAVMMMKMPNMVHKDPTTVTVPPGETKSITWLFKGGDLVVFACNIPGHYQSGMFKKSPMITEEEHDEEHAEEEEHAKEEHAH